jgi:hypothetical protein
MVICRVLIPTCHLHMSQVQCIDISAQNLFYLISFDSAARKEPGYSQCLVCNCFKIVQLMHWLKKYVLIAISKSQSF